MVELPADQQAFAKATVLAVAEAALSSVCEGDRACDVWCDSTRDAALSLIQAAERAASRAVAQASSLKFILPPHSKIRRMASQAAEEARRAVELGRTAEEPEDFDRALGKAQRAVVALFRLAGAPVPPLPIDQV